MTYRKTVKHLPNLVNVKSILNLWLLFVNMAFSLSKICTIELSCKALNITRDASKTGISSPLKNAVLKSAKSSLSRANVIVFFIKLFFPEPFAVLKSPWSLSRCPFFSSMILKQKISKFFLLFFFNLVTFKILPYSMVKVRVVKRQNYGLTEVIRAFLGFVAKRPLPKLGIFYQQNIKIWREKNLTNQSF